MPAEFAWVSCEHTPSSWKPDKPTSVWNLHCTTWSSQYCFPQLPKRHTWCGCEVPGM